ncbi:uncharacterized protein LOC134271475 isoform X2 [Saccostrea cucullata]|uniref:uncharacterized protein LOC134271475 isoform X2 n=1 Tax=Saccostrea cuccullata TaxID=36930 RepID=UPI002ED42FAC
MNSLSRSTNYQKIDCSPDNMIYIAQQNMRYAGGIVNPFSTNKIECQKHGDPTECFRSIPADFDVDFTSYFNISQKCNGMRMCILTFSDYYNSVRKFLDSCELGGRYDFEQVRNMANYECLATETVFHVRSNITVIRQGTVYLTVSTNTGCHVTGKINASRILEQTHVELRISHDSNQICTEWSGAFYYNKEFSCIKGLDDVLIYVDVKKTNASTSLWIEIKGDHLQIDCREEYFSDMPLVPEESSRNLVFILGGVGIALIAGAICVFVVVKIRPDFNKHNINEKVRPTSTFNHQDGVQKNSRMNKDSANQIKGFKSNREISNTDKTETLLPVQDGDYSLIRAPNFEEQNDKVKGGNTVTTDTPSQVQDGIYSLSKASDFDGEKDSVKDGKIDMTETSLPVQDGMYSLISASDFGEKSDIMKDDKFSDQENKEKITKLNDSGNPDTNQIIGEVTGDVYASVCKRDNLEDSRIAGPKGDIYTTVSMPSKTK